MIKARRMAGFLYLAKVSWGMRASFAGIRDKIDRAEYHSNELEKAIQEWGTSKEKMNPFSFKPQPEWKKLLVTHSKVRPDDPTWALLFGDAIHNLRSALDHIVCQLTILAGNDVSCCEKTYFPICICKPDFVKFRKMAEHLISPNAFTCIEELQPYKTAHVTGTKPASASLWIIHQLDIIDKHRILVVVGKHFRTTDIACSFNDGEFIPIPVDTSWRPLKEGTEIAEIDVTLFTSTQPTLDDKMRVQGGTEVQVLVNETGCACDGVEVGTVLKSCIRYVRDVADFFEKEFFS